MPGPGGSSTPPASSTVPYPSSPGRCATGGRTPYSLDPVEAYRFPSVERLRTLDPDDPVVGELRARAPPRLDAARRLPRRRSRQRRDRRSVARRIVWRLGLGSEAEEYVADLVADRDLLWSAAHQPGGLGEEAVLQLASYLGTPGRERALYALERAPTGRPRTLAGRAPQAAPRAPADGALRSRGDRRRRPVGRRAAPARRPRRDRVGRRRRPPRRACPRAYLLRQAASTIARQTRLLDPVPGPNDARVRVTPAPERAGGGSMSPPATAPACSRRSPASSPTRALAVDDAVVATWDDGAAIESFRVTGRRPDPEALEAAIGSSLSALRLETPPDRRRL